MGSGRGDRNQVVVDYLQLLEAAEFQWGPVVVTGISSNSAIEWTDATWFQWGPVVVTGIRARR